MSTSDAPRNIPVPDALAAVRAQLKELETQEAELKRILLTDPTTRTGAAWVAEVREIETSRVDIKELRAAYPAEVDEHTHLLKTTRVELSAIDADTGEIVSPQRKAAQRRRVVQDVVREWLKENPGQDRLNMPAEEFNRRFQAATESQPT